VQPDKSKLFTFQYLLLQVASLSEENAFALLRADSPDNHITYSSFCQALCQVLKKAYVCYVKAFILEYAGADVTVNAVRNGPP
jgi:hypothetical protein